MCCELADHRHDFTPSSKQQRCVEATMRDSNNCACALLLVRLRALLLVSACTYACYYVERFVLELFKVRCPPSAQTLASAYARIRLLCYTQPARMHCVD
jgi:hypothetical protein